jgi:hypothetical protein
MNDRITPKNDLAFKKILASEDKKDISCGFIRDFWGIETSEQDLAITSPYDIKAYREVMKETGMDIIKLRQTILDVSFSVRVRDMQVELQVRKEKYFLERSLLYAFKKYCANYNKEGFMESVGKEEKDKKLRYDRYSSLRPVYSLNILDYDYFSNANALHIFKLYDEETGEGFAKDLISIGYFELTKEKFKNENQRCWRDFLLTGVAPESSPAYIKKAEGLIEYINMDEEEKEMFDALEKAQADYDAYFVTAYNTGKEDGWKGGWEGGKEEERKKVVELANKARDFDDFKRMIGLKAGK